MKAEIYLIFLYLLIFIYSSSRHKENKQIDLVDYKFQLFNFINGEDNNSDDISDKNNNTSDDIPGDTPETGDGGEDNDKKVLIILLIVGSAIVLITIVVIIAFFIKSKLAYEKLNDKINQISFAEENNNRETKTEDLN